MDQKHTLEEDVTCLCNNFDMERQNTISGRKNWIQQVSLIKTEKTKERNGENQQFNLE